ncbi:unnamed protein product [Paramecium pentaurelia]|uniref:Uncharacterized protein n=1 Tax=Paramecium pentaurelia TaxID=43138 RepID=A0A8S1VGR7_9CILI|nr:unnamed protein product [Paramecium pentaurelia]
METVSQQIKHLNQKNQELTALENRLIQLKQQLNLQEANNNIIQAKVEKIVNAKKQKFEDQMELSKIMEANNNNDNGIQNQIRKNKQQQQEEAKKMKQDIFDEKCLKTALAKQQLALQMYQNKKKREEELLEKQQQYARISEWEFNMKQDLEQKKAEKIEKIRQEQNLFKEQISKRLQEQQTLCDQMSTEEQRLLNKLKDSQIHGNNLKNDLMTALNLSIKEYNNISGLRPQNPKSYSLQKLPKQSQNSPYAQLPTMLKLKVNGQLSNYLNSNSSFRESLMKEYQFSLPSLCKPSFNEQKQQVERLYQSKTIKNIKQDLQYILNFCDNKSKSSYSKQKGRMNQSEVLSSDNHSISQKQNRKISQQQSISKQQSKELEKSTQNQQQSN